MSCQVDVFQIYLDMQKEYGLVFAVQQAYLIDHLFCSIVIGCVKDLTFQFDWIYMENNGTVLDAFNNGTQMD